MTKPISLALAASILIVVAGCKKKDDSAAADADAASSATTASSAVVSTGDTLGGGFEGALTMHVGDSHRPAADITFLVKGDKLRFDPPSHHGEMSHVIFESGAKKMLVIMDGQKTYMEMEAPTIHADTTTNHVPSAEASVTKTGKHEKVAGYDCEDWDIKERSGKRSQACIAEGIPFLDFTNVGTGGAVASANPWMQELHEKKLFPLRAIEQDATGKEVSRMEVTKIEKKKLDDAQFAIPAGYKKLELPHFRGGEGPGGIIPPPRK
jgi:hypothetical protein